MADYEKIMIAGNDVRDGAMNYYIKLGEIIGTSKSLPVSDFSSLISNLGSGDTISLVLEIKEDNKTPKKRKRKKWEDDWKTVKIPKEFKALKRYRIIKRLKILKR